MNRPTSADDPQGHDWEWFEGETEHRQFTTIIWSGYSPGTGEYDAVKAVWSLDEDNQLLFLESVSVKHPYQSWNDFLTNPANLLSSRHKGIAREVAREYFGMQKFKSRTRFSPQE